VAAFACHALATVFKGQFGMRIIVESLHLGLMAQGAGLCSDKVGWILSSLLRRGCSVLLGAC
jgi:hypothetical protein